MGARGQERDGAAQPSGYALRGEHAPQPADQRLEAHPAEAEIQRRLVLDGWHARERLYHDLYPGVHP